MIKMINLQKKIKVEENKKRKRDIDEAINQLINGDLDEALDAYNQ